MASGIYIVTIDSWTPVPVTQDKRYVDICARVDHTNVKVGKAKNLNVRHGNYENEFPCCNVQFRTIAHTEDIRAAERAVKQAIQPYRMKSPKGGLMEWLEGIPAGRVRELVLAALAESGVPHEVVQVGAAGHALTQLQTPWIAITYLDQLPKLSDPRAQE